MRSLIFNGLVEQSLDHPASTPGMLSLSYFLGVSQSPLFSVYLNLVVSTIFFYDYLLTFADEVHLLWRRRFSLVTVLFLLCRYSVFLDGLSRFVNYVYWRGDSGTSLSTAGMCKASWVVNELCSITVALTIAIFAAVRLYILWDKSYVVAGSIIGPGLAGTFFMLYYDAHAVINVTTRPSVYKCAMTIRSDQSLGRGLFQQYMIFGLMPLALCALSEFLALLLTIVRTLEIRRVMWTAGVRHSYTHLLVREGVVYFGCMFLASLFCIFIYPADPLMQSSCACNTLLSIFLCRFIFNLRNADYQQNDPCASTMSIGFVSASGSLINRVLDNIAAPISGAESGSEAQLALSPVSMDYTQEKLNEANCGSC